MKLIYSRWLQQTVQKESDNIITAVSTYLDSRSERQAVINADTNELKITDAYLESLRLPGKYLEHPLTTTLPLVGITAYFGSGKKLLQALQSYDQDVIDLVLETITAIIQAETSFYRERNIEVSTHQEYDFFWEKMYLNSCHYYSNLPRVKRRFMENIQPQYRDTHLFCRQRVVSYYQLSDSDFRLNINLADSYHEMSLVVETSGMDHVITGIWGNLLRYPDKVCQETEQNLQKLIGRSLAKTPAKEIINLIGSKDGCTHLGQMLVEGRKSIKV